MARGHSDAILQSVAVVAAYPHEKPGSSSDFLRRAFWPAVVGEVISAPGLVYGGCHGDDELAVFEQLSQIVEEMIDLYAKEGRSLPPPTSGRDYANKLQRVA